MNAGSASMNGGMTEGSVGRSVLSEVDAAGGPAVVAGHESNVSAPFPGGGEISQGGLYDDEVFEEDDGDGGLLEQCSVQVGVTSGAEVMETPSGAVKFNNPQYQTPMPHHLPDANDMCTNNF